MIFNINNKQYIEFTEERYNNLLQNGYLYIVHHEMEFKHNNDPDLTFFELSFFKTEEEAIKEYANKMKSSSFIGHLIEDEAIEMIEIHDNIKFLMLNTPLM